MNSPEDTSGATGVAAGPIGSAPFVGVQYLTEKPSYYRRLDGSVWGPLGRLSLHNGLWWADVGMPIAPEGCEKNLPVFEPNNPAQTAGQETNK